ncbi:hypothetical protein PNE60_23905, partial [Escherichia coli]|nr:hypothetical protein [Escherichia coli]MDB8181099.1 hypothetical protein [Escherichia coli]MDB8186023.1 hypothetical protein [Escherichia coli]MDB8190839.1 hypothetical protein [Escherichia coli]MDB8195759.1 hypothetical protein [Escherichia coli]
MKEKRNDAELKNRKTKRDYDYERRVSDIYFDLFFVFVAAGTFLWVIMHSIFDAGNDSNLLIVFYVQIMPDDLVMQLHR